MPSEDQIVGYCFTFLYVVMLLLLAPKGKTAVLAKNEHLINGD